MAELEYNETQKIKEITEKIDETINKIEFLTELGIHEISKTDHLSCEEKLNLNLEMLTILKE